jgi:protoporphyrinogen oxidase
MKCAGRIGQPIRFNHAPTSIDWKNKQLVFADERAPYRALISTAPLDVLVKLLADAPAAVREAGELLKCNPLWYLDVALDRPCGIDMHWVYVPEETSGCTYSSRLSFGVKIQFTLMSADSVCWSSSPKM